MVRYLFIYLLALKTFMGNRSLFILIRYFHFYNFIFFFIKDVFKVKVCGSLENF